LDDFPHVIWEIFFTAVWIEPAGKSMAVLLTLTAAMVAEGWDEAAEGSTNAARDYAVINAYRLW
jgi:hypothetical protein